VGTSRKLAAVKVAGQWIVGPDNGLLCGVVRGREPEGIWEIANPSLWRPVISNTFHGRDILAPAAAHLLARGAPEVLGPRMNKVIHLANFDPRETEQGLVGEVIFRDAFGNLITNVRGDRLGSRPENQDWEIEIAGSHVQGLVRSYAHRMHGELVALVGSSGWVEIAIVNGDASRFLSAGRHDGLVSQAWPWRLAIARTGGTPRRPAHPEDRTIRATRRSGSSSHTTSLTCGIPSRHSTSGRSAIH
jgi:S-adenosylmethionine hydrolase